MFFRNQEIDRFPHGDARRFGEVGMHPHRDVVRGRLGARPAQMHVLAHDELERADQRGLERRDNHLAVTLRRVSIADLELRPDHEYRDEQLGSSD